MYDTNRRLIGADVVALWEEKDLQEMHHPYYDHKSMGLKDCTGEPLLHPVMENGKRTRPPMSVTEIAAFSKSKVDGLPEEYKRFDNPHIYKVGLSKALKDERDQLIKNMKK